MLQTRKQRLEARLANYEIEFSRLHWDIEGEELQKWTKKYEREMDNLKSEISRCEEE